MLGGVLPASAALACSRAALGSSTRAPAGRSASLTTLLTLPSASSSRTYDATKRVILRLSLLKHGHDCSFLGGRQVWVLTATRHTCGLPPSGSVASKVMPFDTPGGGGTGGGARCPAGLAHAASTSLELRVAPPVSICNADRLYEYMAYIGFLANARSVAPIRVVMG